MSAIPSKFDLDQRVLDVSSGPTGAAMPCLDSRRKFGSFDGPSKRFETSISALLPCNKKFHVLHGPGVHPRHEAVNVTEDPEVFYLLPTECEDSRSVPPHVLSCWRTPKQGLSMMA